MTRYLCFLVEGILLFFVLSGCPTQGEGSLGSREEKINRLIYWSAEFGYNCALAGMGREEMHRKLRERKVSE